MTAATEPPPRIRTLDIVRGVAVMGILAMNITAFTMPQAAYFNPEVYGGAEGENLVAWVLAHVFIDGKMRGLFSLLFGASMLLVIETAEAKGENPASVHYRRMFWLLVFGAVHFYFIWWGDILLHYALLGLVAYSFQALSVRGLVIWAVILLVADALLLGMAGMAFLKFSAAAHAPGATPAVIAQWTSMSADFAPLAPPALAADLALYRGGYAGIVEHRLANDLWTPFFFLLIGGFETLALMAIGMIGLRTGFLTGEWPLARYRRLAFWGIALGAAGFAVSAWINVRSGFDVATVFATGFPAMIPFRLLMVLGYAALIILLTREGGRLVERIAAAGRAAFTNYLGTSLVLTALFYGWGLGLYGRFERAEVYLFVLATWALMLLWSKPWLDRYRYGPFEWLWRTLARGRVQPMRRPAAAATA